MGLALRANVMHEIEDQAAKVRHLAAHGNFELDRLRDETATLQALIAEAARVKQMAKR
jgi:hypothetical protein